MQSVLQWHNIRSGLKDAATEAVHKAVIAVGRAQAEQLPEDVADGVLALFTHPDPEVRVEAIRAIGVHWRVVGAAEALVGVLYRDEDSLVRLSAIGGLGAIGRDQIATRCFVSKILADVVLNESFADYQRMVAYLELLHVEGRIGFREYMNRDRDLPESLANVDVDRPWVEDLAQRSCSDE